jgi:hypothetical protein
MDKDITTVTPASGPSTVPRKKTEEVLTKVVHAGPAAIDTRLAELDQEWTIGRAIKVTAALAILGGLALAYFVNSWWLLLPGFIGLMLAQYGFSKHSMLTSFFRQFGLRHSVEIEHERLALKALRGDFRNLPTVYDKDDDEALDRMEGEGGPPAGPAMDPPKTDGKAVVSQVLETVKK